MKEDALQRFLGLVEKTGDKVIVTDPAGEHPYVLMSLDQYERLLGGASAQPATEAEPRKRQQPTAKPAVKKDFALWRAQLGRETAAEAPLRELSRIPAAKAKLSIPPLDELKLDAEGEEQFYLEPLE